eukprot:TRINITY_DN82891_c0_g1_i1.p1 TRINITY_DN82891_c0_g1~~TRINITY_DN82891_c0_g1_i1.p1  ORF type:complete len:287 (+),score=58.04 TRINITY_DN82891_c0_g1_i1:48-863(+)
MARTEKSSFDRVFARQPGKVGREDGEPPAVSELFSMAMRDQLPLPQFAEALLHLHGVRITPAAGRLLSSIEASQGTLPFSKFQKALNEDPSAVAGLEAGLSNLYVDKASAIIEDNSGEKNPPQVRGRGEMGKHNTDISADSFVKAQHRISKTQARGPFSGGIVMPTNDCSRGNPLAFRDESPPRGAPAGGSAEDPYGVRDMVATATRMFVGGELDQQGYEKFLDRFGIKPNAESELRKLIDSHARANDGKFVPLLRAVQDELKKVGISVAG